MTEKKCMVCGKIIPEERHICLHCEGTNDMQTFNVINREPEVTNRSRLRNMSDYVLANTIHDAICSAFEGKLPPTVYEIEKWLKSEVQNGESD